MAPAKPTNFKTYEAQARLLAALLAAHPELKPNYREIARHYGSIQTASAIEHRFRPLRSAAEALRIMVDNNQDPALLEDVLQKKVVEIARNFGGSTPDGIQFQFRQIKANSEALKNAVKNGEDPVEAFANSNGVPKNALPTAATPGSRKRGHAGAAPATPKPKTGGSAGTSASRTKSTRKTKPVKYQEEDEEEDESSNVDYSELDLSPTKHTKKVKMTPAKVSKAPETTAAANETAPAMDSAAPTPTDDGNDEVIFMKQEIADDDIVATSSTSQPQPSSGTREPGSSFTSHGGNGYAFRAGNGYTSHAVNGYNSQAGNAYGFASLAGASNYGYGHPHSFGGYQQSSAFNDYLNAQIGQGPTTTNNANNANDYDDEEIFANAPDYPDMEVSDDEHGAI